MAKACLVLLCLLAAAAGQASAGSKTYELKKFPPVKKKLPTCGLYCEAQSNPKTACWKCQGYSRSKHQFTLELSSCKFETLCCTYPPGCEISKPRRRSGCITNTVTVSVPSGFSHAQLVCKRKDMAYKQPVKAFKNKTVSHSTGRSLLGTSLLGKYFGVKRTVERRPSPCPSPQPSPVASPTYPKPEFLSCPHKGWFKYPGNKKKQYKCCFAGSKSTCSAATAWAVCSFTIKFTDRLVCPNTPTPAPSPVGTVNVTTVGGGTGGSGGGTQSGGKPCPSPRPVKVVKPCPSPRPKVVKRSPSPCPSPHMPKKKAVKKVIKKVVHKAVKKAGHY